MRQMRQVQCHACRRVCAYEWRRRWEKAVQNRGFFRIAASFPASSQHFPAFPTFSHLIFSAKRGGKSEVRSQPRHKTSGCAWTRKSERGRLEVGSSGQNIAKRAEFARVSPW